MSTPSTTEKMHELAALLLNRADAAVSPLSVQLCLAMLLAGAADCTHDEPEGQTSPTHREICAALGLDPSAEQDFLAACALLRVALTAEVPNVQVDMASALFCAAGIKETYKAVCADSLGAEALPLPGAAKINEWVSEHTRGMVPKVLEDEPEGPLVLVQALVFAAKFRDMFDPAKTRPGKFAAPAGPLDVQMMTITANFRYAATEDVQLVELPYGAAQDGHPFVAYVFLPRGRADLAHTVRTLVADHKAFQGVVESLESTDVQLSLPQFKLHSAASIADALKALGVLAPFGAAADFARMTDVNVFVKDVLHVVRLEVNELGTKAAAATAALVQTRGSRPPRGGPVVMTVASPFAFLVAHPQTGTLLFAAVVSNPVA